MRAFVTGGSGFVGGALCRNLSSRGYEVTALVRKTSQTDALESLGAKMVVGDVRDKASFASAMADIDVVYHVAAAFREVKLSEEVYHDTNVNGTRNVIEAAAESGVKRVVHCSSIGVHGDTGKTPATEESPIAPPDYYCQTKFEGEVLAQELFSTLGIEGVIFRPLGIYGPGDSRFLPLFRAICHRRFRMIGSGETLYHLTYIDDLCRGIVLCGEREEAVGEVFILGGEAAVTLNEWVAEIAKTVDAQIPRLHVPLAPAMMAAIACETICRPLHIEPPLHRRRMELFSKDRTADISKAVRVLGYRPEVPLPDGLRRTAAWYRQEDLL